MPAKSGKQYRFMQAAAHGGLRGMGPSPDVAKEFIDATPSNKRSAFMKGFGKKKKGK